MKLSFRTALIWSALSGFLALSWEIVWARVFNFASGSRAPVFGFMLASYLAGLALGSLWSKKWHRLADNDLSPMRRQLETLIFTGAFSAVFVVYATAGLATKGQWQWG